VRKIEEGATWNIENEKIEYTYTKKEKWVNTGAEERKDWTKNLKYAEYE
jgi:hypothetical protein